MYISLFLNKEDKEHTYSSYIENDVNKPPLYAAPPELQSSDFIIKQKVITPPEIVVTEYLVSDCFDEFLNEESGKDKTITLPDIQVSNLTYSEKDYKLSYYSHLENDTFDFELKKDKFNYDLTKEEYYLYLHIIAAEVSGSWDVSSVGLCSTAIVNQIKHKSMPNTMKEVLTHDNSFSTYASGAYKNSKISENIITAADASLQDFNFFGELDPNNKVTAFCTREYFDDCSSQSWWNKIEYVFQDHNICYFLID